MNVENVTGISVAEDKRYFYRLEYWLLTSDRLALTRNSRKTGVGNLPVIHASGWGSYESDFSGNRAEGLFCGQAITSEKPTSVIVREVVVRPGGKIRIADNP